MRFIVLQRVAAVFGSLVVAGAAPVQGMAQTSDPCQDRSLASPALQSEAWTADAARWLHDRGAMAGWPLPQGRIPAGVAACLLDRASDMADVAPARRWFRRISAEAGDAALRTNGETRTSLGGDVAIAGWQGRAAPGEGLVGPDAKGAVPLADDRGLDAGAWMVAAAGPLYGFVEPGVAPGGSLALRAVDVGAQAGPLGIAIGRGTVAYGSGGLVFSGQAPLNRLEVSTVRPIQLPGALSFLGPAAGHTFLATLSDPRHSGRPWLWGGSVTLQPSSRLELGLHRGMMLGGDGPTTPVTLETVFYAFLGKHNTFSGVYVGDIRTQILSVDVRYRLPVHPAWPITAYLEWGTEDSAGGFRDVPGIAAGIRTSPLLGEIPLTLGVEQIYMGLGHRRGNPPWYRHGVFWGGWAAHDVPLGHPLGGHGREWAAYLWTDAPVGGRLDLRAMRRQRGELNLFVPGWEGRSLALDLSGAWALRPGMNLLGVSQWEGGTDWRRWGVRIGLEGTLP